MRKKDLIIAISKIQNDHEELKKEADKLNFIKNTEILYGFYGEKDQTGISMGIQSNLIRPIRENTHGIGLSFECRLCDKEEYLWSFDGEVGFSDYEIGFDNIYEVFHDHETFFKSLQVFNSLLITEFKKLIYSLPKI